MRREGASFKNCNSINGETWLYFTILCWCKSPFLRSRVPSLVTSRWVCSPWQFLQFNFLQGGSALYGAHPWHWNLTQGLPTVLASFVVPLGVGVHLARSDRLQRCGLLRFCELGME